MAYCQGYIKCNHTEFVLRVGASVIHQILLSKFKLYGLDTKAVLINYNRWKCIRYVKSHTYGTAQGSILGSLIFIIYVNDLFNELSLKDNVIMYADDTLLASNC